MADIREIHCVCGHALSMHDDDGCLFLIYEHEHTPPTDCRCEAFKEATGSYGFTSV